MRAETLTTPNSGIAQGEVKVPYVEDQRANDSLKEILTESADSPAVLEVRVLANSNPESSQSAVPSVVSIEGDLAQLSESEIKDLEHKAIKKVWDEIVGPHEQGDNIAPLSVMAAANEPMKRAAQDLQERIKKARSASNPSPGTSLSSPEGSGSGGKKAVTPQNEFSNQTETGSESVPEISIDKITIKQSPKPEKIESNLNPAVATFNGFSGNFTAAGLSQEPIRVVPPAIKMPTPLRSKETLPSQAETPEKVRLFNEKMKELREKNPKKTQPQTDLEISANPDGKTLGHNGIVPAENLILKNDGDEILPIKEQGEASGPITETDSKKRNSEKENSREGLSKIASKYAEAARKKREERAAALESAYGVGTEFEKSEIEKQKNIAAEIITSKEAQPDTVIPSNTQEKFTPSIQYETPAMEERFMKEENLAHSKVRAFEKYLENPAEYAGPAKNEFARIFAESGSANTPEDKERIKQHYAADLAAEIEREEETWRHNDRVADIRGTWKKNWFRKIIPIPQAGMVIGKSFTTLGKNIQVGLMQAVNWIPGWFGREVYSPEELENKRHERHEAWQRAGENLDATLPWRGVWGRNMIRNWQRKSVENETARYEARGVNDFVTRKKSANYDALRAAYDEKKKNGLLKEGEALEGAYEDEIPLVNIASVSEMIGANKEEREKQLAFRQKAIKDILGRHPRIQLTQAEMRRAAASKKKPLPNAALMQMISRFDRDDARKKKSDSDAKALVLEIMSQDQNWKESIAENYR